MLGISISFTIERKWYDCITVSFLCEQISQREFGLVNVARSCFMGDQTRPAARWRDQTS